MRGENSVPSPSTDETHGSGSPTPPAMRAIVQDTYGRADVLRLATIDRPRPGDHDILVRVAAAGLDRGAWHAMTGLPYLGRLYFGLRRPKNPVLGSEVAGTVAALGSAVTGFAVGDEVFGFGPGAFAEYALVAEDRLARKPASLSFAQAGAHVTGVCSPAKADLVRSLGADDIVDRTRQDFADGSRRYDLIIDIAGNPTLSRLRRALTPRGTAVLTGGEHGGTLTGGMGRQIRALALSPFIGQRLTMFIADVRTSDLARLTTMVDDGTLATSLQRTFPLEQAPEAMRRMEAGEGGGKVAITV